MIEFGKILDLDKNYLRVQLRTGERIYAPIVTMGANVSLPSEKWVQSNKDNFLALVAYEKGIWENPMIIGFYPVKGGESKSYNTHERLLAMVVKLIEQLLKAKVNTQIGPQPFMQDTIKVFNEIKSELDEIDKLILPLKL